MYAAESEVAAGAQKTARGFERSGQRPRDSRSHAVDDANPGLVQNCRVLGGLIWLVI